MSRKHINWQAVADFQADSPKGVRVVYVANMTSPGWVTGQIQVNRGSKNARITACSTTTAKLLTTLEQKLYEKFPSMRPVPKPFPQTLAQCMIS